MIGRKKNGHTLRHRILTVFLLCSLAMITTMTSLVIYTYVHLITPRVREEYSDSANRLTFSLSEVIDALNHVSQQLAYNDEVLDKFATYLNAQDQYTRINALEILTHSANLASFSNPSTGMYSYIDPDSGKQYLTTAMGGVNVRKPDEEDLLFRYSGVAYYGPFTSQCGYTNRQVISITRDIEVNGIPVTLYVESNYRVLDEILKAYLLPDCHFLLLNNQQKVVYSTWPENYPKGSLLELPETGLFFQNVKQDYLFTAKSNQGWHAVIAVDRRVYHAELVSLLRGYIFSMIAALLLIGLCFAVLQRKICKPLQAYDRAMDVMLSEKSEEISLMEQNGVETGIADYDRLISKTLNMRKQLEYNISEVIRQEKLNASITISRLRSQINPHFLMNTLNTVHWMAMMKNENEIDDLVVALNRLLAYNLKQSGNMATIHEELKALEQYIKLQSKRYNIRYQVTCIPPEFDPMIRFPRFTLQPLVENSLNHGYRDGMTIEVLIEVNDRIRVSVKDDGIGMSNEKLEILKEHLNNRKSKDETPGKGMGIGMRYVAETLHAAYPGNVEFHVTSQKEHGTTVSISVPKEVGIDDECPDRG